MSFLPIIGYVLLYTLGVGVFFWVIKYAVALYVFSKKKEEINKLEARLSVLKMHLKGKIKIKYNKIDKLSKKDPELVSAVKANLNTITALTFNDKADYQTLLTNLAEITDKVSDYVKYKHKNLTHADKEKDAPPLVLSQQDELIEKCKKLIKYDRGHVTVVLEIITTTADLRVKIEEFNYLAEYENNQKKIERIPEYIEINNFEILTDLINKPIIAVGRADFPILEKSLFDDAA